MISKVYLFLIAAKKQHSDGKWKLVRRCLFWAEYTVASKPESISIFTKGYNTQEKLLNRSMCGNPRQFWFLGCSPIYWRYLGGGGGCLVLERSGLETVSGTLYEIQKKALLRQTMMSKLKVQLEILSSPIKLFLWFPCL